jgi:hypothetical protein
MNERQAAKNGTDDARELEVPSFPISCVFIKPLCLNLDKEHTAKLIGKPNQFDDIHGDAASVDNHRNHVTHRNQKPLEVARCKS